MIRLTDATRLAATKLRTRKVRLIITVVIAGLLFSSLSAASQIGRGVFASLADFNQEGFGQRYIIMATPQGDPSAGAGDYIDSQEAVDRALAIQKERVTKKTVEAKRLGITYDPKSEQPVLNEFDSPEGKRRLLNIGQPAADQTVREYIATHPLPGKPALEKLAAPYGKTGMYQSKALMQGPNMPQLKLLKDGKESFEVSNKQGGMPQSGLESFTQSWGLMSRDLMQPFILPGATATLGSDGSIPVIAPYSAVEQLQGLKSLPASTSPAERLERLKQVRAAAGGLSFQVCYRNRESSDLISQAISQQQEIERNKNDKAYVKPARQFGLPTQACAPAPVIRDVRTATDKKTDEKTETFDGLFGKKAPEQQLLKLRIIGIAPDPPNFSASALSQIVNSIIASNLGFSAAVWYTPLELEDSTPILDKLFDDPEAVNLGAIPAMNYLEFNDAASAKRFADENTCTPDFSVAAGPGNPIADPFAACAAAGKNFGFVPFGSNALALEDAKHWFNRIFGYAALVTAAIAGIIMIGTVGRIIADSRRETAVFRAIGAKKLDIALTYLIYTLFLSLMILGFALIVGFLIGQFAHARYAPEFTVQSLLAYNAQDLTRTFSLYMFYIPDMLKLLGLTLAGGALSATFPLLRNLRRNPIRDMRDDT
jgi:hypothetical protein